MFILQNVICLFLYLVPISLTFPHALNNKIFHSSILARFSSNPSVFHKKNLIHGKIVVSGIGNNDEDEHFLRILNDQEAWDPLILVGEDVAQIRKRFLSRTARYSGLLNILNVMKANISNYDELAPILSGASTWIAFNVSRSDIVKYSQYAIDANVKRLIITTALPLYSILRDSSLPEFQTAIKMFITSGGSFTGIRHGDVVVGDEDFPYDIVNASQPCSSQPIERGVLNRVVAELIHINNATNIECGVSSSNVVAHAYLNVLRSSGLSRREEVEKVLSGGIGRAVKIIQEKSEYLENGSIKGNREEETVNNLIPVDKPFVSTMGITNMNKQEKAFATESKRQMMDRLANDILAEAYERMHLKCRNLNVVNVLSKDEFYKANKGKAYELAGKQVDEYFDKEKFNIDKEKFVSAYLDYDERNRELLANLINFERDEAKHLFEKSEVWVKYMYLVIKRVIARCDELNVSLCDLDEDSQTKIIVDADKEWKRVAGLGIIDDVYKFKYTSIAISKLNHDNDIVKAYGLDRQPREIYNELESQYGHLFKSVKILRDMNQKLIDAKEHLNAGIYLNDRNSTAILDITTVRH